MAKLKNGIFVRPHIRKLLSDPLFSRSMNETEREVWESIVDIVHNLSGNKKEA